MSWEDIDSKEHKCPCGKGHYVVVLRSDDWGRFDDHWTMDCKSCASNLITIYDLYSYSFNRKGLTSTHFGWINKSLSAELHALEETIESEKHEFESYLRTNYQQRWLEH